MDGLMITPPTRSGWYTKVPPVPITPDLTMITPRTMLTVSKQRLVFGVWKKMFK